MIGEREKILVLNSKYLSYLEQVGIVAVIYFSIACGALAGAYLFNSLGFRNSMERLWDVLGLVVLGSAVSPTISATSGTVSFYLSGIIPWAAIGSFWTKKLVELHGGKISVKSIYGEGSTFTFSIPIQQVVN